MPKHSQDANTPENERYLTTFDSPIGWIGILQFGEILQRIRIGFDSQFELFQAFAEYETGPTDPGKPQQLLIQRIQKLLSGEPDDLSDLPINTQSLTDFQRLVVDQCRKIPFGKTLTYGQLAAKVGRPKAARAVGGVMRTNRFPIVIPCHRVVAANSIGGFTSPNGVSTKATLQSIERHLSGSYEL